MGRKKIEIDPVQVEKLAQVGCTDEEIGDILGASADTIRRRFAVFLIKGRADLKMRLRMAQLKAANRGNVPMLIWLGKQILGQKEPKAEATDPISPEEVKALVAEMTAGLFGARGRP